ncbi:hypothetical protein [Streptomyces sp. NPDC002851]
MGAVDFFTIATGDNLETAFKTVREQAAWDHGHSGYTGTVAEKDKVTLINEPQRSEEDATLRAEELINNDDPRVSSKYGPAGALPITTDTGEDGWLIFGLAAY